MIEHDSNGAPGTEAPAAGEAKREPIVIKRYTNRKLYDTVESRYVTLDEIAQMIKGGAEVKIVDNRSKEDLTSVTLAQIIFEEEKKKSHMPLGVLREIIRHGADSVTGFIAERKERITEGVGGVVGKVTSLKEEAAQRLDKLFKRGEGKGADLRELLANSKKSIEEFQRRVDEKVKSAVDTVGGFPELKKELAHLAERLDELEKKLGEIRE